MSIPIVTTQMGEHPAMPYAAVVEYIDMYLDLAEDVIAEDADDVHVMLVEGITGGFVVYTSSIRILPSWQDEPVEQWIGNEDVHVTVRDAYRLIEAGVAAYGGACDSMEAAVERLADNAIPRGPEYVMAEGHWMRLGTYDEACAYVASCPEPVELMPTYACAYEVFGRSATGLTCGEWYVAPETADRLEAEGHNVRVFRVV